MRGILHCWIKQSERVEEFKQNQSKRYSLHSKFHLVTGAEILTDTEYGHLQVSGPLFAHGFVKTSHFGEACLCGIEELRCGKNSDTELEFLNFSAGNTLLGIEASPMLGATPLDPLTLEITVRFPSFFNLSYPNTFFHRMSVCQQMEQTLESKGYL